MPSLIAAILAKKDINFSVLIDPFRGHSWPHGVLFLSARQRGEARWILLGAYAACVFRKPGEPLGKSAKLALGRARTVADLPYPGGLDEKHTRAANRAFGVSIAPLVAAGQNYSSGRAAGSEYYLIDWRGGAATSGRR